MEQTFGKVVDDDFMNYMLGIDGSRNYYYGEIIKLVLKNDIKSLRKIKRILEEKFNCNEDDVEEEEYFDIMLKTVVEKIDMNSRYVWAQLVFVKNNLWSSLYESVVNHIDYKESFYG